MQFIIIILRDIYVLEERYHEQWTYDVELHVVCEVPSMSHTLKKKVQFLTAALHIYATSRSTRLALISIKTVNGDKILIALY